ncbi:MAG: CvpA family protein [Bacteroidota bacterium]|nr:CvpA family protein [Bacteroidota bacterium]
MNFLDIVLLVILAGAAVKGWRNGIISEIVSLGALIVGVWGAILFSHLVASVITSVTGKHSVLLGTIAFLLTFILILVLVHMFGAFVESMIKKVALGPVNRALGATFSLMKWAFLLSILFYILNGIDSHSKIISQETKKESLFYSPVVCVAPLTFPFLKEEFNDLTSKKPQLEKKNHK